MNITTQIHHYLTTAAGSHFLGQEVNMVEQWSGRDNLLWRVATRGQEAVVKLYLDAGQARGRRQFDGQERYAPRGLAPRPLWFDRYPEGLSRQLLVYVWAPGAQLEFAQESARMASAHSVAQLHNGDPTQVRRFCPHPVNLDYFWRVERGGHPAVQHWLDQQASALRPIFAQLAEAAGRLVAAALPFWQGVAPTPVHGDLRTEHFIDSFGSVVLLDWELFGLGDPALDVASLLHNSLHELDEAILARWLDDYLGGFDQPGLAERINVYRRLLPFQSLSFLLHGLRDHWMQPGDRQAKAAAAGFLAQALVASLRQSAQALGVTVDESVVAALIDALLAPQAPSTK